MRWIVGLDLLELSVGALRFASWLRRRAPEERSCGVHVLTPHPLRQSLANKTEEEFRLWVHGLAQECVDQAGVAEQLDGVVLVEGETAEEGLLAALAAERGKALIIGRKAASGAESFVRLGRVARRLLRQMPAPIVVVPPDLERELPPGPVVLATDLGPSAASALRFAQALAETIGRELLVVYAYEVHSPLQSYVNPSVWGQATLEATAAAESSVAAYCEEHQLSVRSLVVRGPTAHGVLETAVREKACMIVTGSRQLSLLDRIFTSSVGGDLAALASIPVAVVPASPPA
jgi:nucleotide-binding universal stress UspA family protein